MGITKSDVQLLEKAVAHKKIDSVIELGSQNLYLSGSKFPPFASEWFKSRNIDYSCIDLAGDNGAYQYDLSRPIDHNRKYDLVTDFGTSEHVVQMDEFVKVGFHDGYINSIYPKGDVSVEAGYYNCWVNKFNLLNVGGLMINVNPKTGNWPGHGYTYLTVDFYKELSKISGLHIVNLHEHAAEGNTNDGWNICAVLQKTSEVFPSFNQFLTLPMFKA